MGHNSLVYELIGIVRLGVVVVRAPLGDLRRRHHAAAVGVVFFGSFGVRRVPVSHVVLPLIHDFLHRLCPIVVINGRGLQPFVELVVQEE